MVDIAQAARERRNVSIYDKKVRGIAYQAALAVSLTVIIVGIATQTVSNMKQRGIPLTFDFWNQTAGFQSSQTLIPYDALSTYGQAFWVGVANTLLVSAFGILLATSIGFVIGISRLSSNWIVAKVATSYVEVVRNIPLLLQLLFWYNAVLKPLPAPKASISLPGGTGPISVNGTELTADLRHIDSVRGNAGWFFSTSTCSRI